MSFEDISEDLAFLETWENRLEYVIDLGKAMPRLNANEMTQEYKVEGCASNVWLVPELESDSLSFRGGSDALIVSGIIAILLELVNNRKAAEIFKLDIKSEFDKIGLSAHLTSQRSNGLAAMIDRIQQIASKAQG